MTHVDCGTVMRASRRRPTTTRGEEAMSGKRPVVFLLMAALGACSRGVVGGDGDASVSRPPQGGDTGGAGPSGGNTGSGGAGPSGGNTGTGGASPSGGNTGTGGASPS